MKKKIALYFAAAVACLLLLGQCGADETPAPRPAASVAQTPDVAPAPDVAPEPDTFDTDIQLAALEMSWEEATGSNRSLMCQGWILDSDSMVDAFLGSSGGKFDRDVVADFFEGKC